MKVAAENEFFRELKKLCHSEMGLIPKSAVVEAFNNVKFNLDKETKKRTN